METVLTLNAGSSSLKFSVATQSGDRILWGQASGIGGDGKFTAHVADGQIEQRLPALTQRGAREAVLGFIHQQGLDGFRGVGHRIVHGWLQFTRAEIIDEEKLTQLRHMPIEGQLHMPYELDMLEAVGSMLPNVPQIACFDTAFHADQDESVRRFPLPDIYWHKGYRRFGFHGLNYQHVAETLNPIAQRVIAAHLGSGASLCAMHYGKSVATTMGYSALDGLIMSTRPGALDAGLLLGLMKFEDLDHDQLETILYRESGLKALSGISADMRDLLASQEPRAKMAVEMYCKSIAQHAASLAVQLGGLDLLVFTGGVGENAPYIRERVLELLSFLPKFNHHIIPADEERVIAEQVWELVG